MTEAESLFQYFTTLTEKNDLPFLPRLLLALIYKAASSGRDKKKQ